ncbi:hypothetical protein G6F62_015100 [Rhizopus arrhizus]|nr:hypothetical protein G6F62_015100 [Rhizopus arrhizus]
MGASAVLLFAAPASPLAQPWSILAGNLVSALIGVFCAQMIPVTGPAVPASPQRRGGADCRAGRAVRRQPGLWLRAVAGGAELPDPAVHRRRVQWRAQAQLPPAPRRSGPWPSHPRRGAQRPAGLQGR